LLTCTSLCRTTSFDV